MTIASTTNRVSYTGNGAVDTYAYTFKIFTEDDLLVTVKNTATPPVETTLTKTTDYTVTGVGETSGGNVALVNASQAWLDGDGDLLTNYELVIRRVVNLTQDTDIRNQGSFYPETHENALDKIVMMNQQQQDELDRTSKLPETLTSSEFDPTLPTDIGTADRVLKVNSSGNGFETGPTTAEISSASSNASLAKDWATKTNGIVASTDYSSKAWSIGGTDVTETASRGAAKEWATKTDNPVDTSEFSAKEYAQGSQASTGGSAKNWATQTGADVTGASAGDMSAKEWSVGTLGRGVSGEGSSKDWATYAAGTVDDTEYSSKAWSVGGTGVTDTATRGASKEWATKTSSTVDTSEFSSKEYAQGNQASTGGSAKNWAQQTGADVTGASAGDMSSKEWAVGTLGRGVVNEGSSKDWATYTSGTVDDTEYSSKAWSVGGTGVTDTASRGASKEWATKTSSTVDTSEYSSKEYAQGSQASTGGSAKNWATQTGADVTGASVGDMSAKEWAVGTLGRGVANEGSSKDWATYTSGTVDDTDYSAKYYANLAQTYSNQRLYRDTIYITSADSPVTLTTSDVGKLYSIDASGGAITFNLPGISTFTTTGPYVFLATDTSNTITISRNGTDTIGPDALTFVTLDNVGDQKILVPDTGATPDNWALIVNGSASAGGAGGTSIIKTYKANNDGDTDWTVASADDVLPDFDGSDSLAGTLASSSTGDALFSNDDADAVYAYSSAVGSQYDAFGVNINIPKWARGKDIGLSFYYRTKDTSGNSADADYMLWVFDQTNGVNTTTTTTGSQVAGSTLTVGTTTGMAVGDKIWIGETGGTTKVTEAFVISIPTGTTLTISEDVNLSSGDRFITGILTDILTTLDAADSDTNKIGEKFQVTFLPEETTAQVTVMFQQLTSQTDSFIYFDGMEVDGSPFAKISTQGVSGKYTIVQDGTDGMSSTAGELQFNSGDSGFTENYDDAFSKYMTIDHSSDPSKWTAKQKVKVNIAASGASNAQYACLNIGKNGTMVVGGSDAAAATTNSNVSGEFILETGDYITLAFGDPVARENWSNNNAWSNAAADFHVAMTATPMVNESVIVESANSTISDWVDAGETEISATTTAPTKASTKTLDKVWYRFDGQDALIKIQYSQPNNTGAADGSGDYKIKLPAGLKADTTIVEPFTTVLGVKTGAAFDDFNWTNHLGTCTLSNDGNAATGVVTLFDEDYVRFTAASWATDSAGNVCGAMSSAFFSFSSFATTEFQFTAEFRVPIQGRTSTNKPLLAFPTVTYGQEPESVYCYNITGFGSGNTFVPYFANVRDNTISNLAAFDATNTTNGAILTASQRCIATIGFSTYDSSGGELAVVKNATAAELDATCNNIKGKWVASGYSISTKAAVGAGSTILEAGDTLAFLVSDTTNTRTGSELDYLSITLEPIQGVTNQAAIISQPQVVIEERKQGAAGGSSANTVHTRVLNSIYGDIGGVNVVLDGGTTGIGGTNTDVTFNDDGIYEIEYSCPAFATDATQAFLHDGTNYISTGSAEGANASSSVQIRCPGYYHGFIKAGTTIQLRHWTAAAKASNGLGVTIYASTNNPATYDVYSQMRITRKK